MFVVHVTHRSSMKPHVLALVLILVAALWRVMTVYQPGLSNVAPVAALAFCGAVYLRDWRWWLVPFAALTLSDLWLNHYYSSQFGYAWPPGAMALRAAGFGAAIGIGWLVARRRNVVTLAVGALGSSLIFYAASNSVSWLTDPYYAKTAAGWLQALTVGHPEFPSTLWFFRNTLIGDLLFTGVFAGALELAARQHRRAMSEA
jgi:hypothetical protein